MNFNNKSYTLMIRNYFYIEKFYPEYGKFEEDIDRIIKTNVNSVIFKVFNSQKFVNKNVVFKNN